MHLFKLLISRAVKYPKNLKIEPFLIKRQINPEIYENYHADPRFTTTSMNGNLQRLMMTHTRTSTGVKANATNLNSSSQS